MWNFKVGYLLVFVVLLSSLVIGTEITNPSVVSSMGVEVVQSGILTVGDGVIDATLDLYIPQQNDFQKRLSLEVNSNDYDIIRDKYGNEFLRITWKNPDSVINFEVKVVVDVFRSEISSSKDQVFFINPTELVDSSNSDVINKAEQIIVGKKTDFEKVAEISKWVHNNLEYDLNYKDVNISASETLKNGKGVCSEYSVLFQGLARAIGFETRSVLGWVISQYDEPYEFQAHSWSEVKLGDYYIPIDSTWGEGGMVDATHIRFASFPDSIYKEALTRVTARTSVDKPSIDLETKVNVLSFTEESAIDIESVLLDEEVWDGSVVVKTKLKSDECVLLKIRSISCGADNKDFFNVRKNKDIVYFCGETNYFSIFDLPDDLKSNTAYTCPVTIASNFGGQETLTVKMKRGSETGNPKLVVSSDSVIPGEKITIESDENDIFSSTGEYGNGKLEITSGGSDFIVYSYSNGGLNSQKVSVVSSKPFSLSLDMNETMISGKNYSVNVTVKNLLEENQIIILKLGNISKEIAISPSSSTMSPLSITADSDLIQVFANNGEFSTSSAKSVDLVIQKNGLDFIFDIINSVIERILFIVDGI